MFIWNKMGAKSSTLRSTTGSRRCLSPKQTQQRPSTCCPVQPYINITAHAVISCGGALRRCCPLLPIQPSQWEGVSVLTFTAHRIAKYSTTKVGPRCCLRVLRLRSESALRGWLLGLGSESGILFIKAPTKIEM